MTGSAKLTLGPLLFNWPADRVRDFYARIADEAPVDTVHLGEAVCAKRVPLLAEAMLEAAERLETAGKEVVWSSLALIADATDMERTRALVELPGGIVEANDLTALPLLPGRRLAIGPTVNVYNEGTLAWLAAHGAVRVCLPPELPRDAVAVLGAAAPALGIDLEVQVFGRLPLALSARCYHARAHRLHKDGCQFVCGDDPDGMEVDTLDGEGFLAVNGIQTLSHAVADLSAEAAELCGLGIGRFRLSPHAIDMVEIARIWRDLLDAALDPAAARARIAALTPFAPLANGYYHGRPGAELTA